MTADVTTATADAYVLSVKEAAAILGVPVSAISRYIASGDLACLRTHGKVLTRIWRGRTQHYVKSGRVKFCRADLDDWIARHRAAARPQPQHPTSINPAPDLPPASGDYVW